MVAKIAVTNETHFYLGNVTAQLAEKRMNQAEIVRKVARVAQLIFLSLAIFLAIFLFPSPFCLFCLAPLACSYLSGKISTIFSNLKSYLETILKKELITDEKEVTFIPNADGSQTQIPAPNRNYVRQDRWSVPGALCPDLWVKKDYLARMITR